MSRTVLITGGAGFIGSHTADALLEKGYHVRVLDLLDDQIHGPDRRRPDYLDSRVELMIGDVRSRADVTRAVSDVHAVFHFAAQTGVGQSMVDIHDYSDVNINGTAMLLDVLARADHSIKKLVLSSSRAVYGEGAYQCAKCGPVSPPIRTRAQLANKIWDVMCPTCNSALEATPTSESSPLNSTSIYALTKRVQEDLVRLFSYTYDVPAVILRYFNVYGPRQALNNPYTGIGAIFTNRILEGQDISVYEDGDPGRDFVHVRDIVQANVLALENDRANAGSFNVGTGTRLSVFELAKALKEKLDGSVSLTLTGEYRIGDIRNCYADLTRSREILGYSPEIQFADGIQDLIDWARKE